MVALVFVMYGAFVRLGPVPMLALAPVAAIVLGLGTVVVVAALKKAVMGTFKPEIKPLWSMYVWLNEMVNGAYESVVAPVLSPHSGHRSSPRSCDSWAAGSAGTPSSRRPSSPSGTWWRSVTTARSTRGS